MKKRLLTLLSCCALVLSGCGNVADRSGGSGASQTTESVTAPAPAETTAAVTETMPSPTSAPQTELTTESASATEPAVIIPDAEKKDSSSGDESSSPDGGEQKTDSDKITSPHSSAYALYCLDDGELVAGKGLGKKIAMASTTKLLTASLMLKYFDPGEYVNVGQEVYYAQPESTMSYLQPGTYLSVYDLLAGMLLPSGNDAAYTVAVNTARSASGDWYMSDDDAIAYFVGMMNDHAAELGMSKSHFANPEGWDDPEHYTTLNDMLKLTEHVMGIPVLREITSTYQYTFDNEISGYLIWTNTNLFLDPYSAYYRDDCTGIKTGTTANAGSCLIAAFENGGKTYICAAMGCNENEDRYILIEKILEKYLPIDQ